MRTPLLRVHLGEEGAELVSERGGQRDRVPLEDRHLVAEGARRRGDLHPDPAGADEHDPAAAARDRRAEALAVVDGAQVVHAVEVGSRDGEPARDGPGREQQVAVAAASHRRP